ncbi:MAG TPA: hypothetical protein VMT92_08900 [Steroidobacteraceae bacterium]|nr:hypothetical protein [Steroidobacteraceae bacterium]
MQRYRATRIVAAIAAGMLFGPLARGDDGMVAGHWEKRQHDLNYFGVTSVFSCDGLREEIKMLLRAAGARADVDVRMSCSNPVEGPSRITDAHATFYVLVPGAAGEEPVVGAWHKVEFRAGRPAWLSEGDCELVAQFAKDLLPLLTTRGVENRVNCVPHETVVGSLKLRFETLALVPKPRPARTQ